MPGMSGLVFSGKRGRLLKTGQTTQYSSELDDGYYEKGLSRGYTVLSTGGYSGTINIDLTHFASTCAFDAATKTITKVGAMGVFKAAGGETIVISGAGQAGNNGVFTTASATADTVVTVEALTDEAAGPTVIIKKRESHSNNAVFDQRTGLMWSRYVSGKMGTGGTGGMPWTGVPYDIFAYCAAANAASLAGYTDWRVPNIEESLNLRIFEAPAVSVDSTAFPSGLNGWCSTTVPDDVTRSWLIDASPLNSQPKTLAVTVPLVRGG